MEYTINKKPGFAVVGRQICVSTVGGNQFQEIPEFWQQVMEDGSFEQLAKEMSELGVMGITLDYDEEAESIDYLIAIEKPAKNDAFQDLPDLVEAAIPASTWAVFTEKGPATRISSIYQQIYQEWFPAVDFEHAGTPELEIYNIDHSTGEISSFEIWIPINNQDEIQKN